MTGVFLAFGGVVVLLFLIGPVYGWVSGWRRERRRRNQALGCGTSRSLRG